MRLSLVKEVLMIIRSAKELEVYKLAYKLAMEVFQLSREFPLEERYALTSQIRRSSRSVCLNLREAWAKRRYEPHFISKLTDCDGENSETNTALQFCLDCGFYDRVTHARLNAMNESIGRMLGTMLRNPKPFLARKAAVTPLRPPTFDGLGHPPSDF
jgi:four helix bundle protein